MTPAARIRARWAALPRRGKWIAAAVVAIGLLVLGAVGAGLWLMASYLAVSERLAAEEYSQPFTIGGQRVIVSRANQPNRAFYVEICDAESGALLVRSSVSASPYSRWSITEDNGVIWFHSGDIGMFLYTRSETGAWEEQHWDPASEIARRYRLPDSVHAKLGPTQQRQLDPWRRK